MTKAQMIQFMSRRRQDDDPDQADVQQEVAEIYEAHGCSPLRNPARRSAPTGGTTLSTAAEHQCSAGTEQPDQIERQ
jgi:hypothetical protein